MAGKLHQGTLELFRHDPWLAFDLLGIERPVIGTPLDRRAEVERDHPNKPGDVESNYPDIILVHGEPGTDEGIVLCVEAQGKLDLDKRWKLPYYQAAAAKDHAFQTWLVVISYARSLSAALAKWRVGPPPVVDALVLDVDTVPRMTSIEQARKRPTAAVLAAALHGCQGDIAAARIGIAATIGLPSERRRSYIGTILAALSAEHKATLIGELSMNERDEVWEIERRSGSYLLGQEVGRRRTLIELIFAVLDVRGVHLDADSEARIRDREDLVTLERWARLAREIKGPSELFAEA